MKYYTYVYLDPRKSGDYSYGSFSFIHEPFYVGKGTSKRYLAHLESAKDRTQSNRSKHNISRIRKILDEGLEPIIIKVLENVSNEDALDCEADLISRIGRQDKGEGPLLNFTDGGGRGPGDNGLEGFRHKEETKRKISETSKGHKKSDEFKRKVGELKKGNTNMLGKKHKPGCMEGRTKRNIIRTLEKMISQGLEFTEDNFDSSRPHIFGYPRYCVLSSYISPEELQEEICRIQQGK